MKVFFIIIFVILLIIAILYLAFLVRVKINITINEAILLIKIKVLKFQKCLVFRFKYMNLIKKYFNKDKKKKSRLNINVVKSLIRPFFIKNIDIYTECFEEKFSVAIEFSIVNIITKRGVLSE